ncbi:hypothetical protein Vadar_019983 [Vaccinium darrowii]|uniref:Uncharacterized protein n=1 Tax=Vaccinium darrowii TaxID=229202 RepID=A0ACB7Y0D4_9ERIC|nr:hypothetical protein Vadar_019983 [Vaccinium darrowii]
MDGVVKEEDEGDEDMKTFMSSKNRISDLPDTRLRVTADSSSLRLANEKIQCENLAIKEAIKNMICRPPFGEEERKLNLQKLKMENSRLKTKGRRLSLLHISHCSATMNGLVKEEDEDDENEDVYDF